jgi:putative NIF3 family GTP cyclohydrolase 1 type 2
MNPISRREFGALVAAGVVAGRLPAPLAFGQDRAAAITATDVVERIKRNIGVEWRPDAVDTVKAGDPSTVVTGVVTTASATLAVMQQAARAGANLIITCEPTFYGRADARTPSATRGRGPGPGVSPATPPADPVYAAKNQFTDDHGLVVFRLSDHWRRRTPDPFAQGLANVMGWGPHRVSGDPLRFEIPAATLERVASDLKRTLGTRGGMRVVGDRNARVRSVALLPGSTPIAAALRAFPNADLVVAGEVREWESVEYARDVALSGQARGLILVGRVVSEDPGMAACATWLRTFVPEVPIAHIPAGDPYWRPGS